jgi:O-antigen/teichoic acid export membrane protein
MDSIRAARSALWSLVENGGLALISMGSLVIYTHLLTSSQFGLFAIVLALTELLQLLVTMPFHDALVQRETVSELHFDTAFTFGVGSSLVLFLACCALSPLLAVLVDNHAAAPVLCCMALCFPAASFSATIVARQRRSLSFRPLAIRSLVGRSVGALAGITLVAFGAGVWGLIAQQVLMALVGSLLLWKTCEQRPRFRFGRREFDELMSFGLYALGALFLNFGVKRLFTLLTGIFLGVAAAGYLNLSFRAVDVLWSISATAVTQVALPMLSSVKCDLPKLRRAFQQANGFVCLVMYACFVGMAVTAPEIVTLLFGAKWLPSAPYVTALSYLVLLQAPLLLLGPALTAVGRPRDLMVCKSIELSFMAAAIFASRVPSLSWAIGIWIATCLVSFPISIVMLKRATALGFLGQFREVAAPLAASGAMLLAVRAARGALPVELSDLARLCALVPIGAICYLGVAYALDRELATTLLGFARSAVGRRGIAAAPGA